MSLEDNASFMRLHADTLVPARTLGQHTWVSVRVIFPCIATLIANHPSPINTSRMACRMGKSNIFHEASSSRCAWISSRMLVVTMGSSFFHTKSSRFFRRVVLISLITAYLRSPITRRWIVFLMGNISAGAGRNRPLRREQKMLPSSDRSS